MNKEEIRIRYSDPQFISRFTELYSFKILLSNCVIAADYETSFEYGNFIVLTSEGEELFNTLTSFYPTYSKVDLILSVFVAFSHENLFIDVMSTNIDGIKKLINSDILNGSLKYPWIYERSIYDQYANLRDDRPEWLLYEEALPLLKSTPTGVFQVNKYIVGPFGLLESNTKRYMPPTRNAPLWHCSDPACEHVHFVEIRSGKHKLLELSSKIEEIYKFSKKSEWLKYFIQDHSGEPDWYDEKHFDQLPNLLINCFSIKEIKQIFINLLEIFPEKLRRLLPKRISQKGSPSNISESLNIDQIFQLMMILSNEEIANSIEELIDSNSIKIPYTELRSSRFSYKRLSGYKIICQCSRFGIRAIPQNRNISTILLKNLIKELYNDENELAWKLRHSDGESNTEKLERYLNNTDPRSIISEFILNSQYYTSRTFKYLGCGKFSLPKNKNEEDFLIEKILWKLGFDIGLYPDHIQLYWMRLNKLQETSKKFINSTEQNKEMIRNAGVNFFVSLEQILDNALSFSTWMLFSDHFAKTEFKFNLKDAQRFSANFLNSTQVEQAEKISYDENGKNTLYPLIQGFKLLAEQVAKALADKDRYIRSTDEFPVFFGRSKINKFPFLHGILLMDIRPEDIDNTLNLFESITSELKRVDVCSIRNKIEHKRDDFPTAEEIEKACNTLISITRRMQDAGVLPTIYLYSGMYKDKYGRGYDRLVNYEDKTIEIFTQNEFRSKLPQNKDAQIIVPSMRISNSIEPLRFTYKEDSDFVDMWTNFPKIRQNLIDDFINKSEDEHGSRTVFQIEESIGQ